MASTPGSVSFRAQKIPNLRWWIGCLLFASTVINYIDRQTLSLLAPYLKHDFHWTNTDYANLLIAFRLAYSFGQTICGRFIDRIGTRRGLTLSVIWYSIASICTSFARGFFSFAIIRFLLGACESANWPEATKAVSEWFPKRDRALFGGFGVMLLIPTIFTVNLAVITLLFALATFSYAAFSTIANVLPSDLYTSESVASVSGLSGTGAGIGAIVAFEFIGHFSDSLQSRSTHSFDSIVITAGLVPFCGNDSCVAVGSQHASDSARIGASLVNCASRGRDF